MYEDNDTCQVCHQGALEGWRHEGFASAVAVAEDHYHDMLHKHAIDQLSFIVACHMLGNA